MDNAPPSPYPHPYLDHLLHSWVPVSSIGYPIHFLPIDQFSSQIDWTFKTFSFSSLNLLDIYGIDISNYAINNCHKDIISRVMVGNAKSLPFPDKSFKLVISINTLHNVTFLNLQWITEVLIPFICILIHIQFMIIFFRLQFNVHINLQ